MAATYEATDSATGVHDFVASPKHKRVLVNVTGGDRDTANTEAYSFANEETGVWLYGCADVQAFTNPEPGADGTNTGTFTMTFEITSGDNDLTFDDVLLHRVNSSGVSQASVSTATTTPVTMSTGSHAFTWSSPALGTWAAGDYLGVEVQYTNANKHGGAESVTFQFGNTANTTDLDTPFSFDLTVNHTKLDASPTYGTHDVQLQIDATNLDASAAFGTHDIQLQIDATALAAGATFGTHDIQLQIDASILAAGATFGSHTVGYQVDATVLDASATFGTHDVQLELPATALDAGPTFGTHTVEHVSDHTILDAGPTFGTHSVTVSLGLDHTILDASAAFGTHDVQLQIDASVLAAGATFGTHNLNHDVVATLLDASAAFGTHDVALSLLASVLDASAAFGTHDIQLEIAATILAAGATFGTHDVQLQLDATALDASPTLGSHSVSVLGGGARTGGLTCWQFGGDPSGTGVAYWPNAEFNESVGSATFTGTGYAFRNPGNGWTLRELTWKTAAADSTTDLKIQIDGVVAVTLELTAAAGVITGLTQNVDAGEEIALEFDAGTDPGAGTYTLSGEPG